MSTDLILIPSQKLTRAGLDKLPATITRVGEQAAWRFIEFFTASIRNRNTRAAYSHAVAEFYGLSGVRRLEHG
jgi:hypothetical protein